MGFDLDFAISTLPLILRAIDMTLLVAVTSCIGAAAIGFNLEILRRAGGIFGLIARFFIDFIRATPMLVWLYCLYFILPSTAFA